MFHRNDDGQKRRPLDAIREDELWQKINAAHAKKVQSGEADGRSDEGIARTELLDETSHKLFDDEGTPEIMDDLSLEEHDDKIRDFVHALYRGDELSEQRDPGALRQPTAVRDDDATPEAEPPVATEESAPEAAPPAEAATPKVAEPEPEPAIRAPKMRLAHLDSERFDRPAPERPSRIPAYPMERPAPEVKVDRRRDVVPETPWVPEAGDAEATEHVHEPPEGIREVKISPITFDNVVAEHEAEEADTESDDTAEYFGPRPGIEALPEEEDDVIVAGEAPQKDPYAEIFDDEARPSFTTEEAEEEEDETAVLPEEDPLEHPLFSDMHDSDDTDTEAAPEESEEEVPEILRRDPGTAQIRAPQPIFSEGSQNLVTQEESARRESADREFLDSARYPRQAAIEQTVTKLQSGALAPPFYVPKLPRQASSFEEALDFARRLHPLPQEMQLAQKPTHRTWMLAQLNHCNTQERLSRFAFSLNYEDLALLFPTLASLKRGKHIDRLLSIILMRASHYLYLQGWITLQYAYPRSTVEKGLSELCRILEDSFFPGGPELGEEEREYLERLSFGDQQFIWPKVRLISEIAYPNQRHFISKIISAVKEEGKTLEDFYKEFAVYRDLPLAKAIQSQWDMQRIEQKQSSTYSPRQLFT